MSNNIFNKIFANRILANILMLVLLVLGVYSYKNIRLSLYPEVNYPWTSIRVVYPGAQPEIVAKEITDVIEKEISTIENIDLTVSKTMNQLSIIYLRANFDIKDRDAIFNEIVRKVNNLKLPARAKRPTFLNISTSSVPILKIGITTEFLGKSNKILERLNKASILLEDHISTINGVSNIKIFGKSDQTIKIKIDPYKLKEYGLSMDHIAKIIKANNNDAPGGSLNIGNESYSLRLNSKYRSFNEIKDLPIPLQNSVIHLKDIARITKEFKKPREITKVDMKHGIVLNILKGKDVDTVKLIARIKDTLKVVEDKLPKGIIIHNYADSSIDIIKLLNILERSTILGLIFVFLFLWLIIGMRQAIFASIGIPIAFCFCFILLFLLGDSLNQVTLFGLVLVLGIVVDDAIMVIESVQSKLEKGLYPYYAVKEGIKEIWLPIMCATLTTIVAFVPILLTSGPIGNLMSYISIVVCLTLVGSIIECFLILPSHLIDGTDSREEARPVNKFKHIKSHILKITKSSIRNGPVILILVAGITTFSIITLFLHEKELFANEDLRGFRIGIRTPSGTDKEKTNDILSRSSKLIYKKNNQHIKIISQSAGLFESDAFGTMVKRDSNYGQIYVELKEDSPLSLGQLMSKIKNDLKDIPGISLAKFVKLENAPISQNDIEIVLRGNNYEVLSSMSDELMASFNNEKGILDVSKDRYMGNQQISVNVNRDRAALHGLTNQSLGKEIYRAIEGQDVGTIELADGVELNLVLKLETQSKEDISTIQNMNIRTPKGTFIVLNEVATLNKSYGPSLIGHYNEKKSIIIKASVDDKITSVDTISKRIEKMFPQLERKYKGTTIEFVGTTDEIKSSFTELFYCMILAIFLVYTILAIQFNSLTQPLLIMAMIPVGFIGVSISMMIGDNPLSLFIFIGIIGLSGVIVNDSLVLITFFNKSLAAGKSIEFAVMEGVAKRCRPILITTITTVAGLAPAAIGIMGKSLVWQPLAQTFIAGMIIATICCLFVLPYAYLVLNKYLARQNIFEAITNKLTKFTIEQKKEMELK